MNINIILWRSSSPMNIKNFIFLMSSQRIIVFSYMLLCGVQLKYRGFNDGINLIMMIRLVTISNLVNQDTHSFVLTINKKFYNLNHTIKKCLRIILRNLFSFLAFLLFIDVRWLLGILTLFINLLRSSFFRFKI